MCVYVCICVRACMRKMLLYSIHYIYGHFDFALCYFQKWEVRPLRNFWISLVIQSVYRAGQGIEEDWTLRVGYKYTCVCILLEGFSSFQLNRLIRLLSLSLYLHLTLCLDDTTGINSIYTVYQGHELMFHVSTMLPYSKENKQQVSCKAH